jgi:hypothetical protein
MTEDLIKALAAALSPYMEGAKATGVPTATYMYSGGGLFGRCDGTSHLINAMVGPIGIEKVLTYVGNYTENEFVDTLKAIEVSGSEQSAVCGDCKKISLKACAQLFKFGRFCRQTDEFQFDKLGLKANAQVPMKTMFGAITDAAGNVIIPNGYDVTDAFFLQAAAVGYALRLLHSTLIWSGNHINSNGVYDEFDGLQQIVNTGKYDAYTELDCDTIDSFLLNYNYQNPQSDGYYSVRNWFRRMILQFTRRAEGAGFDWNTAEHYIVMTPNAWESVSKAYSCAGLDLCTSSVDASEIIADADQAQNRFEGYQSSMQLPIFGRMYPVVLDSQIPETTGQANGICSDVYFLTTAINGQTVLYGEYQDFNQTYGKVQAEFRSMFGSDDIAITDNGRYAVIRDNERGCFDIQTYIKPRLIALMPWLSGRIQNVCADVLGEPLPDVTGSGRTYALDGGRTTTPPVVIYGDC